LENIVLLHNYDAIMDYRLVSPRDFKSNFNLFFIIQDILQNL